MPCIRFLSFTTQKLPPVKKSNTNIYSCFGFFFGHFISLLLNMVSLWEGLVAKVVFACQGPQVVISVLVTNRYLSPCSVSQQFVFFASASFTSPVD